MTFDEFDKIVAGATPSEGWAITDEQVIFFPYFDIVSKSCAHAAAFICRVGPLVAIPGTPDRHTVVVAYHQRGSGTEDFSVWCADKFLEGRGLDAAQARDRAEQAAESLGMKSAGLITKYMDSYALHGESDACEFWSKWRKEKVLCVHTATVMAHLRNTRPSFRDELKAKYSEAQSVAASVVPGDIYTLQELAFRVPVLIEGDRGSGKTTDARTFARAGAFAYIETNGHEGLEAPDLLGFLVPGPKGEMIWKDGPLAKAFRAAQSKPVVLVIDEILRIRQRELSVLLTAFSPDIGVYRLPTGRILRVVDGVGEEEVLECPVANLCVIATTNIGSEYAVDAMDPALAERFMPIRKDTEIGNLTKILADIVKARGFDVSLVKSLVGFFVKMTEAKKQGLVADIPTTRTLVRALNLATTQADVIRGLRSQVLLWVARDGDGHPVQEQIDDCTKLMDTLMSPKPVRVKR